jgi:hypothetical protein
LGEPPQPPALRCCSVAWFVSAVFSVCSSSCSSSSCVVRVVTDVYFVRSGLLEDVDVLLERVSGDADNRNGDAARAEKASRGAAVHHTKQKVERRKKKAERQGVGRGPRVRVGSILLVRARSDRRSLIASDVHSHSLSLFLCSSLLFSSLRF